MGAALTWEVISQKSDHVQRIQSMQRTHALHASITHALRYAIIPYDDRSSETHLCLPCLRLLVIQLLIAMHIICPAFFADVLT